MTSAGADHRRHGVSVVMATFNGARHLQEQLESLAVQTFLPEELVVGDDGSSDGTQDLVHAFAAHAPFPIRFHQHRGLGVTDNFLATAAHARSPWIAWSDQDDRWLPGKLAACMDALASHDAVLAFHDAHVTDEALRPTGRTLGLRRYDHLDRFSGNPWEVFHGFATVFSAELLRGVDPAALPPSTLHRGRWHHDELVHELARLTGTRAIVSEPLVLYRQHTTNTAGMPPERSLGWRATVAREGYARRLDAITRARAWARSVPHLAQDPAVDRYLARRVRDESRRAAIWDRPTRLRRSAAVAAGVVSGTYGRRMAGRQGLLSLAKDVRGALRPGAGAA